MGIKELLKMEGREEEREKLTYEHVKAVLNKPGFSIRGIAEMFNLSEYYVRKVKKSMQLN